MLKASLAAGAVVVLPACGNSDERIFAGAATEPIPTTTAAPPPTSAPEPVPASEDEPASDQEQPESPESTEAPSAPVRAAVAGEMVIAFTYTQGVGGKNERPYIAVWIEDAAGELLQTVSLWYQQRRRGQRWLDHLSRWYDVDLERIAAGGVANAATISSATRAPGTYAVVWDGTVDGSMAAAGDYFVCIEAVREDGPLSLIREPFALDGSLRETLLPDTGELSAASVRIDA